jgi:protein-S-isoprenylcysteine O-methyltransferase Ste14
MNWMLLAGALGAAGYYSFELWLRRPTARSWTTGSHDSGTTRLVVTGNVIFAVAPWLVVAALWPPDPLTAGDHALGAVATLTMVAGMGLRLWAMRTLGAYFTRTLTVRSDQTVIDSGPYRVVRHPGYAALLTFLTGYGCLVTGTIWMGVLALVAMALAYTRRIPAEEAMLVSELGDAYRSYQKRTWRIVPFVY